MLPIREITQQERDDEAKVVCKAIKAILKWLDLGLIVARKSNTITIKKDGYDLFYITHNPQTDLEIYLENECRRVRIHNRYRREIAKFFTVVYPKVEVVFHEYHYLVDLIKGRLISLSPETDGYGPVQPGDYPMDGGMR
jgi:hypothetical protein